jgi:hypothetical protein
MRRYLAIVLTTCLLCLGTVGGAAAIVDPYGLIGWIAVDGLNLVKPAAYIQVESAKVRRFLRAAPATVVLGNSRVDIGIDPQSPSWPAGFRPVFNLGVPGGDFADVVRGYLLARDLGVKRMVIALDFADFVSAAEPPASLEQYRPFDTGLSPLLLVKSHLSVRSAIDTLRTLLAQGDPYAETMKADGFNPLRQYVPIIRLEGHAAVAEQRNRENVDAYLRRDGTLTIADGRPNRPMRELALLLADARQAGVEVHMFTFPYQADLLETLNQLGLWPLVEDWKRELHRLATAPKTRAASLWDFTTYSAYATEPIPPPGDTATDMAWYWEPGHFKPALGDRLIAAMFGTATDGADAAGIDLVSADLDAAFAGIRDAEARYGQARPDDVARIGRLIALARQRLGR